MRVRNHKSHSEDSKERLNHEGASERRRGTSRCERGDTHFHSNRLVDREGWVMVGHGTGVRVYEVRTRYGDLTEELTLVTNEIR